MAAACGGGRGCVLGGLRQLRVLSPLPSVHLASRALVSRARQDGVGGSSGGVLPGRSGGSHCRVEADSYLGRVADLLNLVEDSGQWPTELTRAYVAMIPKASGGTRPQDQRPITVLDVVYRLWSKGVVLAWASVLHGEYLGPTTMGFRVHASALHVAQLLNDLILLQQRRGEGLWLVSFDVEKCFPSIPWWAVFGTLEHVGVDPRIVQCYRAFYKSLRQHFRYGQLDGEAWATANGLAQGCPASPDLLNILFEAFHRWAAVQGRGVEVDGSQVASVSYADDVTLVAETWRDMEALVAAYRRWCDLLGLRVNVPKTQVWSNTGAREVILEGTVIATRPTFRVVGIELGEDEWAATAVHFQPRLAKAETTVARIRRLPVPAAVAAQIWRTTALPQLLYGCELRLMYAKMLQGFAARQRLDIARRPPLQLCIYRMAELLGTPALGACSLREPAEEMGLRRLRWLAVVANDTGIVGTLHRLLATRHTADWVEPSTALQTALNDVGWRVVRNHAALCGTDWPRLLPEPSYAGEVRLQPVADPPPPGAAWTDGSLGGSGGAAAVQMDSGRQLQCGLQAARSSTQCELVALQLVRRLEPPPPLVLTDSLCALQLIQGWGRRSTARILESEDRAEVRGFLYQWRDPPPPPRIEEGGCP